MYDVQHKQRLLLYLRITMMIIKIIFIITHTASCYRMISIILTISDFIIYC